MSAVRFSHLSSRLEIAQAETENCLQDPYLKKLRILDCNHWLLFIFHIRSRFEFDINLCLLPHREFCSPVKSGIMLYSRTVEPFRARFFPQDGETTTEIEPEGESHTTVDSAILQEGERLRSSDEQDEATNVEALLSDPSSELTPQIRAAIKAKWQKIIGPDTEIVVSV